MKLVENWRSLWRAFSMQAMVAATALLSTWELLPDDMKATLPTWVVTAAAVTLLVLGIVGRMVDQPSVAGPAKG